MSFLRRLSRAGSHPRDLECSICYGPWQSNNSAEDLRSHAVCGAVWHAECINTWTGSGSTTCPHCRGTIARSAYPRIPSQSGRGGVSGIFNPAYTEIHGRRNARAGSTDNAEIAMRLHNESFARPAPRASNSYVNGYNTNADLNRGRSPSHSGSNFRAHAQIFGGPSRQRSRSRGRAPPSPTRSRTPYRDELAFLNTPVYPRSRSPPTTRRQSVSRLNTDVIDEFIARNAGNRPSTSHQYTGIVPPYMFSRRNEPEIMAQYSGGGGGGSSSSSSGRRRGSQGRGLPSGFNPGNGRFQGRARRNSRGGWDIY